MKKVFIASLSLLVFLLPSATYAQMAPQPYIYNNQQGCVCAEVYQPVCAMNGQTYSNTCKAMCAGVQMQYQGACGAVPYSYPAYPSAPQTQPNPVANIPPKPPAWWSNFGSYWNWNPGSVWY